MLPRTAHVAVASRGRTRALFAFGVVTAGLLFVGRAFGIQWLSVLAKPMPMLAIAISTWGAARDRYAKLILAGLLTGMAGDVLLEVSPRLFVGGLAVFLVGHILYIAAFVQDGRKLRLLVALPFLAYAAAMFATLFPNLGRMVAPVAAYALTIAIMGWRAFARVSGNAKERPDQWAAMIGSLLFMLSDSLIAVNRFYAPIPHVGYVISTTYWLGQLGIGYSVRRPQSVGLQAAAERIEAASSH